MADRGRMAVIVDYQNVHLTGADVFLPHRPVHEALIDPWRFATQLNAARTARLPDGVPAAEVAKVLVFRGLPSQEVDPDGYARNCAQADAWTRGHGHDVEVTLRPLKYDVEWVDGQRRLIASSAREKGVDVLCALALVEAARSGLYDVVVLASRDTDLAPALEAAMVVGRGVKVEAAKWYDPEVRNTKGSIQIGRRGRKFPAGAVPPARRLWTTSMTREHFMASLDPADYS